MVLIGLFLFVACLNLVFTLLDIARPSITDSLYVTQFSVAALLALLVWYHHRSRNTDLVALLTVLLFSGFTIYGVWSLGTNSGSLFITMLLPPIAFFLLGGLRGFAVTALVELLSFAAYRLSTTPAFDPPWSSRFLVANFAVISLSSILVIAYYERSRKAAHDAIERLAVTDRLTGLNNRVRLDQALAAETRRAERSGAPFSLMILDIDHFKWVNDEFGHSIGDEVLKSFAAILRGCSRSIDLVGRWGGEEFLLLCPNTDQSGVVELAERIRRKVEETPFGVAGHRTVSIGVAEFRKGDDERSLLNRADGALYRAKGQGRNQVACG
jgi:diguanylate cyclase (GGDEF)-like protein